MDLAGRIAIVTGGAGGIGRATSVAMAKAGATLVVVDRDLAGAEETARLAGNGAVAKAADVTQSADVRRYVDETLKAHGRIDCFFNNAGIEGKLAPIHEMDEAAFDQVIAVNLRGAFLGLRYVLAAMVAQRSGSVVSTASLGGLRGSPNLGHYVASKHAVMGLTKCAAADVAAHGVRVNAVCPGPIETRMINAIDAQRRELAPNAALAASATYGVADDVANLVVFLLSDLARNITGAGFSTDGGRSALPGPGLLTRAEL